jgi:hypothetical protein
MYLVLFLPPPLPTNELFNDDVLGVGVISRRRVTFILLLIVVLFHDAILTAEIHGVEGCC